LLLLLPPDVNPTAVNKYININLKKKRKRKKERKHSFEKCAYRWVMLHNFIIMQGEKKKNHKIGLLIAQPLHVFANPRKFYFT
jgi:hypothetical protein